MRKVLILCLVTLIFTGCAVSRKISNENIEIRFLDEYILPEDLKFQNSVVGGLSGIDYKDNHFYLVSDQASSPRVYTAKIEIENQKIESIQLLELLRIKKEGDFSEEVLDLEAIRIDPKTGEILVSSEGMINDGKDPGIYRLNSQGSIQNSFKIPAYFKATGKQKPRNNGVFEGLTLSFDKNGIWAITELPLEKDGAKPKLYPTRSHVRLTRFDKNTGEPVEQFAYKLDGISKLPINYFAINGATEILEYAEDKFLVLERAFSAGYGSKGNTVKIFEVDVSEATNTLKFDRLKKEDYKKTKKRLIFNFKSVKDQLTDGIIDNLEGMCFGPALSNGKQSLILVSDNNFNSYGRQLNQFILLEIDIKK